MSVQHIKFALRNDSKKLYRAQELLRMQDEIQKARQAFETEQEKVDE